MGDNYYSTTLDVITDIFDNLQDKYTDKTLKLCADNVITEEKRMARDKLVTTICQTAKNNVLNEFQKDYSNCKVLLENL